jgi:hypothetical protein
LDKSDRSAIGADLPKVQFGWPIGMPLVRKLADDIWGAVRASEPTDGTLAVRDRRATNRRASRLHQETQKTPPGDIALARRRLREMLW